MTGQIEVVLVDIGNTRIKSAEASNGVLQNIKNWEDFSSLYHAYPVGTQFMLCSTRSGKYDYEGVLILHHQTPLPIELSYDTPETLGTDRIAAAVGAFDMFPGTNTLVIDLGTCMTMDMVTDSGVFEGGIISPGLTMRMKSMAQLTANLPDISQRWNEIKKNNLGRSTDQCLLAGSFGGMLREIKGTISELEKDFTTINVILTGGDAHHFESNLKAPIFAGSKIVLTGLYRIWKSQQKGN